MSLGDRVLGRTVADDVKHPTKGTMIITAGELVGEVGARGDRQGRRAADPHPLGADLRDRHRRLRQVLWARSCPRHARQHGRSGRRHRRPVDRRAGHPAHHAHLPHRWRGAGRRSFVRRIDLRRHHQDQEPLGRSQRRQAADLDGPQPHHRRRRRRGQGAGVAPRRLRFGASRSTTATRSRREPGSPSGTRSPGRSSPKSKASPSSRI